MWSWCWLRQCLCSANLSGRTCWQKRDALRLEHWFRHCDGQPSLLDVCCGREELEERYLHLLRLRLATMGGAGYCSQQR